MTKTFDQGYLDATGYTTQQAADTNRKALTPYEISLYCETDAQTTCTLADTWYPIDGDFTDGSSNGFSYVTSGGRMVKTGTYESRLSFNGSSDVSIGTSAATITYGLFVALDGINFVEDVRFRSPKNFTTNETSKELTTVGVTSDVIPVGAAGEVRVMSSVAGVVVTHHTLKVSSLEV
jgi:hypothetical protein